MPGIFVSYRRADSQGITAHIVDRLNIAFGEPMVFRDIYDIGPGYDFTQVLQNALAESTVMILVIGPSWVAELQRRQQRDQGVEIDWVRQEVRTALMRGIPIIPVLVDGARMPRPNDLPYELSSLPQYGSNAIPIYQSTFNTDIVPLLNSIRQLPDAQSILLGTLQLWLNFDSADLIANRQTKLSKRQTKLRGRFGYRQQTEMPSYCGLGCWLPILPIPIGILIYYLSSNDRSFLSYMAMCATCTFMIAIFAGFGMAFRNYTVHKVYFQDGFIKVGQTTSFRMSNADEVQVGKRNLMLNDTRLTEEARAQLAQIPLRVYYARFLPSAILLSAEPLSPNTLSARRREP